MFNELLRSCEQMDEILDSPKLAEAISRAIYTMAMESKLKELKEVKKKLEPECRR